MLAYTPADRGALLRECKQLCAADVKAGKCVLFARWYNVTEHGENDGRLLLGW